jgi:hypothetical protein
MNRTSFLCLNRNGHHNTQNVKTHNRTKQKSKNIFSFDLFMVYIPECKQQLRTMKHRYHILHTLNLGYCFITLREPCNNQRPTCDIAWLHVTNYLYHGFPELNC